MCACACRKEFCVDPLYPSFLFSRHVPPPSPHKHVLPCSLSSPSLAWHLSSYPPFQDFSRFPRSPCACAGHAASAPVKAFAHRFPHFSPAGLSPHLPRQRTCNTHRDCLAVDACTTPFASLWWCADSPSGRVSSPICSHHNHCCCCPLLSPWQPLPSRRRMRLHAAWCCPHHRATPSNHRRVHLFAFFLVRQLAFIMALPLLC